MTTQKELIDYLSRSLDQLQEENRIIEQMDTLNEHLSELSDSVQRLEGIIDGLDKVINGAVDRMQSLLKDGESIYEKNAKKIEGKLGSAINALSKVDKLLELSKDIDAGSLISDSRYDYVLGNIRSRIKPMPSSGKDSKAEARNEAFREIYEIVVDEIYRPGNTLPRRAY